VNDTTSTPDDPDGPDREGRGTVATGEQEIVDVEKAGNGTAPTTATTAGNGAGAATAAAAAEPATPPATPAPSPSPRPESAQAPGEKPAPAPASGAAVPSASDAPTAQMRLPSAANGAAQDGAAGKTAGDDGTRPVSRSDFAPSPPTGARPAPAPGPVPGPGPAAATPPPWQRVPGGEAQDLAEPPPPVPAATGPAGGLLDDGPTAFLEAPGRTESGTAQDGAQGEKASGWSAVRAVRGRPPRQAALQLKRLDPWSVLKLALVLAVVLFFIWLVAIGVLYGVLDGMGVWDRLNGTYADLVSGEAPTGSPLISAGRVFGLAAVVGAINSLLFAVAITVGAFVYNVSADLVGGIEVTLSERD
jgi:hypothetical protein